MSVFTWTTSGKKWLCRWFSKLTKSNQQWKQHSEIKLKHVLTFPMVYFNSPSLFYTLKQLYNINGIFFILKQCAQKSHFSVVKCLLHVLSQNFKNIYICLCHNVCVLWKSSYNLLLLISAVSSNPKQSNRWKGKIRTGKYLFGFFYFGSAFLYSRCWLLNSCNM